MIDPDFFINNQRLEILPSDIDEPCFRTQIIKNWTESNIIDRTQTRRSSCLSKNTIKAAYVFIKQYLISITEIQSLSILEIFSGNCVASIDIFNELKPESWVCTDITRYHDNLNLKRNMIFDKLNTIEAIQKYGKSANILIMVSAPFGDHYADYYACNDFIQQAQSLYYVGKPKYIIFIGELGASDGSNGMYKYFRI